MQIETHKNETAQDKKSPYVLKALFVCEQLQVLMELQTMFLKEAVEG